MLNSFMLKEVFWTGGMPGAGTILGSVSELSSSCCCFFCLYVQLNWRVTDTERQRQREGKRESGGEKERDKGQHKHHRRSGIVCTGEANSPKCSCA